MKKVLILAMVAFVMYSCGNAKKTNAEDAKVETEEAFNDGHNARNSLSYHGKYMDTIPAASTPGIVVTIEIPNDSTYTRTQVYIGHEKDVYTDEGKYTWNEAGNTITLLGGENPNQYFVAEGRLIMLDAEGKQVEGELAEHYIIKQRENIEY